MKKSTQVNLSHKRHWQWWFLLALLAIVAYFLFRPTKGAKEATITAPNIKQGSGHRVTVPIVINTGGKIINAAQIFLKFDPQQVQVEAMNKEGSFFTVWVKDQPAFSNDKGDISFAGGIFSPGFKGQGRVASVTLVSKRATKTQLTFTPETSVLLNDGLGTAIPLHLEPIKVDIP